MFLSIPSISFKALMKRLSSFKNGKSFSLDVFNKLILSWLTNVKIRKFKSWITSHTKWLLATLFNWKLSGSLFLLAYSFLKFKIVLAYNCLTICVSFRCTAKWISYTCIRSFLDSFPIQVIIEYWGDFPVLHSRPLLLIYFIYSSVYMLIPNS